MPPSLRIRVSHPLYQISKLPEPRGDTVAKAYCGVMGIVAWQRTSDLKIYISWGRGHKGGFLLQVEVTKAKGTESKKEVVIWKGLGT